MTKKEHNTSMSQNTPQDKKMRQEPAGRSSSSWVPARPRRRGAEPASLAEILVGAQDLLAQKAGTEIPRDEWRSIVGQRIAARTRVGKSWKGVLTIKVASSAWSNELSLLKSGLLSKLRKAGRDYSDLRFRVDKIEELQPRVAKNWRHQAPVSPLEEEKLPPELLQRLKAVEDPNLRAAIFEAARWSLKSK